MRWHWRSRTYFHVDIHIIYCHGKGLYISTRKAAITARKTTRKVAVRARKTTRKIAVRARKTTRKVAIRARKTTRKAAVRARKTTRNVAESESEYLLSQYRFTRKFVLRCTVSDIINNNNLTRLLRLKIHETHNRYFHSIKKSIFTQASLIKPVSYTHLTLPTRRWV